jgi:hypothetical protein
MEAGRERGGGGKVGGEGFGNGITQDKKDKIE